MEELLENIEAAQKFLEALRLPLILLGTAFFGGKIFYKMLGGGDNLRSETISEVGKYVLTIFVIVMLPKLIKKLVENVA